MHGFKMLVGTYVTRYLANRTNLTSCQPHWAAKALCIKTNKYTGMRLYNSLNDPLGFIIQHHMERIKLPAQAKSEQMCQVAARSKKIMKRGMEQTKM